MGIYFGAELHLRRLCLYLSAAGPKLYYTGAYGADFFYGACFRLVFRHFALGRKPFLASQLRCGPRACLGAPHNGAAAHQKIIIFWSPFQWRPFLLAARYFARLFYQGLVTPRDFFWGMQLTKVLKCHDCEGN